MTLTNNEIKEVMKVIKSFETRGLLLKGSTTKIATQEGGFFNFFTPLITAGFPLIKSMLTLFTGMSAADGAIQKIYGSGRPLDLALHTTASIIWNEEMEYTLKMVK